MTTTSRDSPGLPGPGPRIYLLWRRSLSESLRLARRHGAAGEPVVLVHLVSQVVESEAFRSDNGFRVVALPVAFAGLDEQDQVLREAVMQLLREQNAPATLAAAAC